MKRLIPASIIFAIIITVCIIGNTAVVRGVNEAKSEIEKCRYLYDNNRFSEALESALRFKSHWTKSAKSLSAYSNHCPLDDITTLAAILPEAIRQKRDFEVYSTLSQIKAAIKTIRKEQLFTLESLY